MLMARLQAIFAASASICPTGDGDGAHLDDVSSRRFDERSVRPARSICSFANASSRASLRLDDRAGGAAQAAGADFRERARARRFCPASAVGVGGDTGVVPADFGRGRLAHVPMIRSIRASDHREAVPDARRGCVGLFPRTAMPGAVARVLPSRALMVHRARPEAHPAGDSAVSAPGVRRPRSLVAGRVRQGIGSKCFAVRCPRRDRAMRTSTATITHPEVLAEVVRQFFVPPACG